MDTQQLQTKIQSKRFRKIIICLGVGALTLVIFSLGMQVGYIKASFSYRFGDNYYRSFGPMQSASTMKLLSNSVSDAHGVSGTIVSIDLPTFVVADKDNTEKVVHLENETVIREFRNTLLASDLKTGDFIIVIGEPTDTAEVDAKLVRVFPSAEAVPAQ